MRLFRGSAAPPGKGAGRCGEVGEAKFGEEAGRTGGSVVFPLLLPEQLLRGVRRRAAARPPQRPRAVRDRLLLIP